jgi:hypothetical protein
MQADRDFIEVIMLQNYLFISEIKYIYYRLTQLIILYNLTYMGD